MAVPRKMRGLTLVVVLLFGLGTVLIVSAIETDPTTGKSRSVTGTIADVWNNSLDFGQGIVDPITHQHGVFSTNPTLTYQQATTQHYLNLSQHSV